MICSQRRLRVARFVLTAGFVTATVVTGPAGTAVAGTPLPAPSGSILGAGAAGALGDSYIVVLKPGSAAAAQITTSSLALAKRYGGSVRRTYLSAVRGFAVTMPALAARRLAADPAVQYVEQDRVVRRAGVQTDPTWGLDRVDQRDLPLSGTYTAGPAAGVTAYVLDTGIRTSHTEFGGRAVHGWDFIDRDPVADDCNGHGTHVAGTIGGSTYGVTKDVTLVGVRVLDCQGSGSYSQIIAGVDWVTAHAVAPAVANMSLGGEASAALDAAVERSIAKGITYAVAAGNTNSSACDVSPARTGSAITVGATDAADARAWFSNHGSCTDLFAPGAGITSAGIASDSALVRMSGTSMAAPHAAGAAAQVLGRWPGHSPASVREALLADATEGMIMDPGAGSPNRLLRTGSLDAAPDPSATEPPTTAPTTVPATTPPTVPPTTVPPTTVPPTTVPPTTAPPTTAPPTTAPPTTVPPTTVPATTPPTVPPTTAPPTASPTTVPATTAPVPTSRPTTRPTTAPPTASPTTVPPTTVPVPTARPTTAPPASPPTGAPPTLLPPVARTSCGPFTNGRGVALPDRATVAERRVVTSCTGKVTEVSVQVRITHRYRGSLSVTLVAPTGRSYALKPANVRDKATNLVATYAVAAAGAPRNGTWTLQVSDRYLGAGVGRLDSWTLRL